MNVYLAGQIFMISIFALIMSGTFALNRALFQRWSMLPLIAFPLLYNYMFLVGLVNYFFGIGLALWALAAWISRCARRRGRLAMRSRLCSPSHSTFATSSPSASTGSACSPSRSGMRHRWIVRIGARALSASAARGYRSSLLVPFLLTSSTWGHATEWDWESLGKLDGLLYVVETYSDIVAFVLTGDSRRRGGLGDARADAQDPSGPDDAALRGRPSLHVAMPRMLFASYLADQRLPIAIAFMAVACFRVDMRSEYVRRLFLVVSLGLLAARVAEVDIAWANAAPATMEMRESLRKIQRGSKVLVAYTNSDMPNEVQHLGLVHAVSLAIIERQALITTAFTTQGKQIMHVRPEFRKIVDSEDGTPPTIDQLVIDAVGRSTDDTSYWHDWTQKYDYVYLLFTDEDSDNPMPDKLKTMYEGENFQLYRIIRPGMDKKDLETPKRPIHLGPEAAAAAAGLPAPKPTIAPVVPATPLLANPAPIKP